MKRFLRTVLTLSGLCLLYGCGGDGSGSSTPPPPATHFSVVPAQANETAGTAFQRHRDCSRRLEQRGEQLCGDSARHEQRYSSRVLASQFDANEWDRNLFRNIEDCRHANHHRHRHRQRFDQRHFELDQCQRGSSH